MTRKALALLLMLLAIGLAGGCRSINQVTPEAVDEEAMEADVRRAIAGAVPGKTFAIEVKVDNGVVTLNGNVDSETDRRDIAAAVQRVDGVRSVINNIAVK